MNITLNTYETSEEGKSRPTKPRTRTLPQDYKKRLKYFGWEDSPMAAEILRNWKAPEVPTINQIRKPHEICPCDECNDCTKCRKDLLACTDYLYFFWHGKCEGYSHKANRSIYTQIFGVDDKLLKQRRK